MLTSSKRYRRSSSKGFTLIEMLMVVAVICVVTLVVFVRQTQFNSSTLLRSLAYSVALSLEQAQTYGVSVRGFTPSGSGSAQFAPGYGVYFSPTLACTNGSNGCFTIFADLNGDHCRAGDPACIANPGTEDLPAYQINHGYKIKDVCGTWASNSAVRSCIVSPQSGGTQLSSLTVYFKRPDPDAYFYSSTAGGATGETYSTVYVQVWATGDASTVRSVKVTPTGQITVCAPNVDPATC